ncbi:S41 family peptidase [Thalassotalea eurytherma]|nr:S41 family peptidase [Thalassotalea eurytherma]
MRFKSVLLMLLLTVLFARATFANDNPIQLTKEQVDVIVLNAAQEIQSTYYDADKGAQIAIKLNALLKGDYFYSTFREDELETRLNHILFSVSGDGFLSLNRATKSVSSVKLLTDVQPDVDFEIHYQRKENNIGYVRLSGNFQNTASIEQFNHAINQLHSANTLIIDLFDAQHASLKVAHHFLSVFLPPKLHIANVRQDSLSELTPILSADVNVIEKSKSDRPVYILQSAFNEQAWELFTVGMQQYGNAVIVGEESMGNATLSNQVAIGSSFELSVPFAVLEYAHEEGSWANTGVTPDYFASKEEALSLASQLANSSVN